MTDCPATAGTTAASQRSRANMAPAMPKNACSAASSRARIRANSASSGSISAPARRAARRRAARGGSGVSPRLTMPALQRARDFRRHVLLVVLGEHLISHEGAVCAQPAVSHHAGALTEEVRKHLVVHHGHLVVEVGDGEVHLEAARHALQCPLLDHATETEALARGHLPGGHLARSEEERDVLPEGAEGERPGDADAENDAEYQRETATPRGHAASLRICSRRRASRCERASARRAQKMLSAMTTKVMP